MLISINGPIPARLTLIAALESYTALLRSTGWTTPSRDIAKVMHFASGYEHPPTDEDLAIFTDDDLLLFYRNRIITNVNGYADFLISYLRKRLTLLDNLPQTRQAITINTEKAPRFFYNLGKDVAKEITDLVIGYTNDHESLDYLTLSRLFGKIEAQTIVTMGNDGSIGPNPRCDAVVRSLLDLHTSIMRAICKEEERFSQAAADYLTMLLNMMRLYFGAVNQRDDEINTRDVQAISSNLLKVNNDVVCALPAPTFAMLQSFQSRDAAIISPEAVRYVDTLNDYFLIRQ